MSPTARLQTILFLLAAHQDCLQASALPVVDLSHDTTRHVIIAQGTRDVYQGHPTTLLLPDGKTMFCVWTHGHGGTAGPLKRSDDGGLTWSAELPVPENWWQAKNCPALYRLTDPKGVARLFVFTGQGPDGRMHQSVSTDEGCTWSPMQSNGLSCVMPFCTIVPVESGKKLIGLTNIRRPGETKDPRSNIIAKSESNAQYFSTKGVFASYDAKLNEPLTEAVKAVWEEGFKQLQNGTLNPMQLAKSVHATGAQPSPPTEEKRGDFLLTKFSRVSKPH